jgi:nucleoside-diphosphate-sugar epimerase
LKADLTNYDSLKNAFDGVDIIVNIAAEVRNSQKLEETNISGTKNLIKAAIENKISKIIHISSVGVVGMQYSNSSIKVDEEARCFPKNEYEHTKLESERLLIEASQKYNFQLTILRPTNVFGEYHPFNALLNMMQYVNAEKVVFKTSNAIVNYLYVKNLTALIIHLLNDPHSKGIVNVGSSDSLKHFAESISQCLNKKSKLINIPQFLINFIDTIGIKKLRPISNRVIYNDEKLKTFFKYPYSLQSGIERTIACYKNQILIK